MQSKNFTRGSLSAPTNWFRVFVSYTRRSRIGDILGREVSTTMSASRRCQLDFQQE